MAEPLDVDPTIPRLIELIEETDIAIRELKGRVDGNCACIKLLLEQINNNVIES